MSFNRKKESITPHTLDNFNDNIIHHIGIVTEARKGKNAANPWMNSSQKNLHNTAVMNNDLENVVTIKSMTESINTKYKTPSQMSMRLIDGLSASQQEFKCIIPKYDE